ncbi:SRPBCC family protein [Puniceicoccales bacterium CK1056]|uniref:SRPBCC family protein n=1 Tax=Oceanipulchritudo coccoides TaxID=2706888 RepID=A0A6B2LZI2_9BACT|nr:SRPBCC family protein [Oceanipulchritudo coccoides]NDV61853.1 SRPBCC family protein [Oceanipulchritudo coccoides]
MKIVKWLIALVALLLGLFVLITFFLPTEYEIERSTEINTPAELVFSQVVDLVAWQEWNPWNEMDPDMLIEYGELSAGPGASYTWQSDVAGDGAMKIIKVEGMEHVRFELLFEGYEDNPSYSSLFISEGSSEGSSTVRWTFEGNVGDSFFGRWMSVMIDKFVGPSYEKGLQSLKERCEALALDPEAVFKEVPVP